MNEGHVFAEKGEIVIVDLFQLGLWMFMPCSSGGYFSRFWIPLRQRDSLEGALWPKTLFILGPSGGGTFSPREKVPKEILARSQAERGTL
jgi:hypothetical protein